MSAISFPIKAIHQRASLNRQQGTNFAQLAAQAVDAIPIHALADLGGMYGAIVFFIQCNVLHAVVQRRWPHFWRFSQLVARAANGVAVVVEQLTDTADHQDFMVLVIAPIATPFDGFELRKFLLPIAQHMRFDAAQVAHLTDGEVAFRRDFRQCRQGQQQCNEL